jgi:hypothetical protein
MTISEKVSAKALAATVDRVKAPRNYDADKGYAFGAGVAGALRNRGWEHYSPKSSCSKASGEWHLRKGAKTVEIISANFLGAFTQVRMGWGP